MLRGGLYFYGLVMGALIVALVGKAQPVNAQKDPAPSYRTITVTSTRDDIRRNGNCTLREAVQAANTNRAVDRCPAGSSTGADVIQLGKATYALSVTGKYENANQKGDIDITQSVKIQGAGRSSTFIDGKKLDRVFDNRSTGATLTLQDLTVQNGYTFPQGGVTLDEGGAVANKGKLFVTRVRFFNNLVNGDGNDAARGGAILNTGALTISDGIFEKNTAGTGGAIGNSGSAKIDKGTFKSNFAYQAGAIFTAGTSATPSKKALMEISNSRFTGNQNGPGGTSGITQRNGSTTNIQNTIFEGHAGDKLITNEDAMTIRYSTFKNNTATFLISVQFGSLTFTHSTVRNNTGRGITSDNGRLIIDRMTFSDNGSPALAMGGSEARLHNSTLTGLKGPFSAISVSEGSKLAIDMATIADNATDGRAALNVRMSTVTIHNSILANTRRQSDGAPVGDCQVSDGTITSLGYNLISRTDGCDIDPASGDQLGSLAKPIDPLLGVLKDNGGPTFTRGLLPGSPAVDKADPVNFFKTDQRIYHRPAGPRADIGAYERRAVP